MQIHQVIPEEPFSLVDEPLLKHEVRIALEGPSSLYEITKQEFEDDTKDSALLRKANQSSKAWTRWAGIVLDIVTEEQERDSQMGFKGLAQISTEPITSKDYQGLNVGILSGGTTATIEQIIKKHGKPTRVGDVKTRTLKKPVNGKLVEESFETEEFHFDGIIWLECRKDNGKVQWLYAPTMWFIEGIRKKAQRTIERTK